MILKSKYYKQCNFKEWKPSPSKEVHIEPAFFAVIGEGDSAGDGFVIAFHIEVVADVRVISFFVWVALAACHKCFFIFPHHLEVSVGDFDGSFTPRRTEIRAGILSTFAAIAKVTVSFIRGEVIASLLVSAGLLFFGGKSQRIQIFCSAIFIDFVEASLTPIFTEERIACRRRRYRNIFG